MPEPVDVVICGSGSAGLAAAVWLARYGIRCKILEQREGPMKFGQADGIQCRTIEIFESFSMAEQLLQECFHVLEVAFWGPDASSGGICRIGRTIDTPQGISHMPHAALNQARFNSFLLDAMYRFNKQEVDYGCTVTSVTIDEESVADVEAYPVKVGFVRDGETETINTKYAVACDGAHSKVRESLEIEMVGDNTEMVWGVMDVIPQTDFPDIRKKTSIRSNSGTIMVIPREGGSLVRLYIELPFGMRAKDVQLDKLQALARQIFIPYTLEFVETDWWSAYAVAQRYAEQFHRFNRVFLAGDASHCHSAKAGQGMNVSFQDGYNLGWKIASVLLGQAHVSLIETYAYERHKVAVELIEFDRYFSKLWVSGAKNGATVTPEQFQEGFLKSTRYASGTTYKYKDSIVTWSKCEQQLATNIVVGMRMPSAQVVRHCDSKPMQLAKALLSDGRWRILAFAGDLSHAGNLSRLNKFGDYLISNEGPLRRFTKRTADIDSLIEPLVIGYGDRHKVELEQLSQCFYPATGKWKIRDVHKIFFDDESYNSGHGKAYEFLGIQPEAGAIVIVRPDQHISAVWGWENLGQISNFFENVMSTKV